jgi:hypothetical protein
MPDRMTTNAPVPILATDVPQAGQPGRRLEDLPGLLRGLGTKAREETLEAIDRVDKETGRSLRKAIRRAPMEISALVHETMEAAVRAAEERGAGTLGAREMAELGAFDRLYLKVLRDPRSAFEAAEAIDSLVLGLSRLPVVKQAVSDALDILEDKGVLGQGTLASVVRFLSAAAAIGAQIAKFREGGRVEMRIGPVALDLYKLDHYRASLEVHNPLWAAQAVEIAVSGTWRPGRDRPAVETVAIKAPIRVPVARLPDLVVSPYARIEPGAGKSGEPGVTGGLEVGFKFGATPDGDGRASAPGGATGDGVVALGTTLAALFGLTRGGSR